MRECRVGYSSSNNLSQYDVVHRISILATSKYWGHAHFMQSTKLLIQLDCHFLGLALLPGRFRCPNVQARNQIAEGVSITLNYLSKLLY